MVSRTDPLLVEVWRGDLLECIHFGALVVTGPGGEVRFSAGDTTTPMLPRSSLKPMQAIGMLRHGLDLDGDLLALAGASHSGEPFHLEGARRILDGAGLSPDDLRTTPGLPLDDAAKAAWLASGRGPAPLPHNCSGKHAAMLRTCVRAGWPTDGYLDASHPLQRACADAVADLTGEECGGPVVDGCGAPAFAVGLTGLARAFGSIASATDGPERRVANAFRTHPEYASGTRRAEVVLHREVPGLVCKVGAEGCLAVGLSDGSGIAVKVSDGHDRGVVPPVVAVLEALGLATPGLASLDPHPVLGHGQPVGRVVVGTALATGIARALS